MPVIQGDNIADLVTTTLKNLGKLKFTMISNDLQHYVVMGKLLKKGKVDFQSGIGIQWNVMFDDLGSAKNTALYATDTLNVADIMTTASAPWRHATTSWGWDRRELAMNREPSRIVNKVETQRIAALKDMADLLEGNFWTKPATSADTLKPFGVKYWIVQSDTEGFNGGDPSGFTDGAGGLATATYGNWKNYTAQYTTVSKEDLVTKMRKATYKCKFEPPTNIKDYNTGDSYGYYTTYDTVASLETLLEAQNDNLGNDIASKDGLLHFRRVPVVPIPYLDANTSNNPVYGINWGVFKPVFLSGEYMRESGPQQVANSHNVYQQFIDLSYNFVCYDRRRNFVMTTAATT